MMAHVLRVWWIEGSAQRTRWTAHSPECFYATILLACRAVQSFSSAREVSSCT